MKKLLIALLLICQNGFSQINARTEFDNSLQEIESYWKMKFNQKEKNFNSPEIKFYSNSESIKTLCGVMDKENAVYCPLENSISINTDLYYKLLNAYNNGVVYMVLAHEYGHAVQMQLSNVPINSTDRELQADCLAGIFFNSIAKKGMVEQIDLVHIQSFYKDYSQEENTIDVSKNSHGSSYKRFEAFKNGYEVGYVSNCMNGYNSVQSDDTVKGLVELYNVFRKK